MERFRAFLRRKNIVFSAKRYGVDALGAMAQGLFCTLLVGTILDTLGTQFHIGFLSATVVTVGSGEAAVGYTIGGLNVPHIILQPLAQNAQFTPDSFKYICQVVNDPQCIAVRKDSPYQSTSEIIAAARKNPGKIRVGLVGPLSGHHLMFLDYGKKYPDAKLTSVFYKGAADQNAALLGGEIDMIFGNINDVMRSIDEFRVLNVAAEKRNDFLPDVPTLREAGIDMVSDIRRCFAAPKGIKPAELDALRVLFKKICEDPEYLADMKKAGQPAEYMDGEAFAAYIAGQQAHAQEALSAAGLLKK